MRSKIINEYDKSTGLHTISYEVWESKEEPGVYLYPDHNNWTLKPLPSLATSEAAKFNKVRDNWDVVPDFTGQTAWDTVSGVSIVVEDVGALPAGYTLIEPQISIDNRNADAKTAQILEMKAKREIVLTRLDGRAGRAAYEGDTTGTEAACRKVILALLDITKDAGILAATDGASAKTALSAAWSKIAANAAASSPEAAKAFAGLQI